MDEDQEYVPAREETGALVGGQESEPERGSDDAEPLPEIPPEIGEDQARDQGYVPAGEAGREETGAQGGQELESERPSQDTEPQTEMDEDQDDESGPEEQSEFETTVDEEEELESEAEFEFELESGELEFSYSDPGSNSSDEECEDDEDQVPHLIKWFLHMFDLYFLHMFDGIESADQGADGSEQFPDPESRLEHHRQLQENLFLHGRAHYHQIQNFKQIHIEKRHIDSGSDQCAICLDISPLGAPVMQMPCLHLFHVRCIFPWLKRARICPLCRYEMKY